MATKLQKIRWDLYCSKRDILFEVGIRMGLIRLYDMELIEKLRNVYYGGIPASIVLLCINLCNGNCYDKALLLGIALGDEDWQMVDADVDGITLNPKNIDECSSYQDSHYGNHCFIERRMQDGTVWVYDTSKGLVYDRRLYYLKERPRITRINSKESLMQWDEYQDIKNADIEKDKYALPLSLPNVEKIVHQSEKLYRDFLLQEIELFKKQIGYEAIYQEMQKGIADLESSRK